MDLDCFKQVNDVYGYVVGDVVLMIIVICLVEILLFEVLLVCIGGEEFLVVLFGLVVCDVCVIVEELCECVMEILVFLFVGCSVDMLLVMILVGIVLVDDYMVDVDILIVYVDCVLLIVKFLGCNCIVMVSLVIVV